MHATPATYSSSRDDIPGQQIHRHATKVIVVTEERLKRGCRSNVVVWPNFETFLGLARLRCQSRSSGTTKAMQLGTAEDESKSYRLESQEPVPAMRQWSKISTILHLGLLDDCGLTAFRSIPIRQQNRRRGFISDASAHLWGVTQQCICFAKYCHDMKECRSHLGLPVKSGGQRPIPCTCKSGHWRHHMCTAPDSSALTEGLHQSAQSSLTLSNRVMVMINAATNPNRRTLIHATNTTIAHGLPLVLH